MENDTIHHGLHRLSQIYKYCDNPRNPWQETASERIQILFLLAQACQTAAVTLFHRGQCPTDQAQTFVTVGHLRDDGRPATRLQLLRLRPMAFAVHRPATILAVRVGPLRTAVHIKFFKGQHPLATSATTYGVRLIQFGSFHNNILFYRWMPQSEAMSPSNTCTAREPHLHGSRGTLARLARDTSVYFPLNSLQYLNKTAIFVAANIKRFSIRKQRNADFRTKKFIIH